MSIFHAVGAVLSVALFIYLGFAMLKPEKF